MTNEEMIEIKIKALQIARDMKPAPVYNNFGTQPYVIPSYNILTEAESIYNWIVKLED